MVQRLFDEVVPYREQEETIKRRVIGFTLSIEAGKNLSSHWHIKGFLPKDFEGKRFAIVPGQKENCLGWYELNEMLQWIYDDGIQT